MLTIQDCIAFSTLTPEEVDSIAEIEHLPEIIAVELAAYLMTMPDGTNRIGIRKGHGRRRSESRFEIAKPLPRGWMIVLFHRIVFGMEGRLDGIVGEPCRERAVVAQ